MFCCKILDTCAYQFSGGWYNSVVHWQAAIGNCANKREGNCTKQLAIGNCTNKQLATVPSNQQLAIVPTIGKVTVPTSSNWKLYQQAAARHRTYAVRLSYQKNNRFEIPLKVLRKTADSPLNQI